MLVLTEGGGIRGVDANVSLDVAPVRRRVAVGARVPGAPGGGRVARRHLHSDYSRVMYSKKERLLSGDRGMFLTDAAPAPAPRSRRQIEAEKKKESEAARKDGRREREGRRGSRTNAAVLHIATVRFPYSVTGRAGMDIQKPKLCQRGCVKS